MADKDLTIKLRLDRSEAKRETEAAVDDLERVGKAGRKAGDDGSQGFGRIGGAAANAAEHVKSTVAGIASVNGLQAGLRTVAETWQQIAANANDAARASLAARDAMRVEAALKGAAGPTNEIVNQALRLRMASGLPAAEASNLERQFEGSLPAGMEKGNINRAVADQLKVKVAQASARLGGDAGIRGDLAGMLGTFGKVESAEAGLGQMEAIRFALTAGRGDDTPLTQALLSVAGSTVKEKGGQVGSLPELAALVGTMSLSASGPAEAGTRTEQLVRALRGGNAQQMGFLKEFAGIGENDDLRARAGKMIPKLRALKDAGRDPVAFLAENQMPFENARALMEFEANYEVAIGRMDAAKAGMGKGAEVDKLNQAFLATPQGQDMIAAAQDDALKIARGRPGERMAAWLHQQEAIDNGPGGASESFVTTLMDNIPGMKKRRQMGQLVDRLGSIAADRGVPFDDLMSAAPVGSDAASRLPAWLDRANDRFQQAGIDPFAELGPKILAALEEGNRIAKEAKGGPAVPPPLNGPPPVPKR